MEAATEQNQDARVGQVHPAAAPEQHLPRSLPDRDDLPPREDRELIDAAARASKSQDKLSPEEQVDALEWFLSDTDATDLTHSFDINVGSVTRKRWVTWTIKPVDMDKLRRIRRQSQQQSRRQRVTGQQDFDDVAANIAIVLEGTVAPDLRAASKEIGTVNPGDAIRARFAHKPGLIAQIAGEIMSLSGYDDEDVREVEAARG